MRKNATFVSFLGIKPEENAVRAAKKGKKVAQKQEGYQFCRRMPQSNKPLSKKSPKTGDVDCPHTIDHTAKIHLKYDKNYTRHLLLYKKRQINGFNIGNESDSVNLMILDVQKS